MSLRPFTVAAALLLGLALVPRASAEPEKQRGQRETRFEKHEIDEAITAARDAADATSKAVSHELETHQDGRKRAEPVQEEVDKLVNALGRLRKKFDDDAAWEEQRAEVRLAFSQWNVLDPKLRHHWASDARDEFEDLHVKLRRLARIYQIDSPAR